MRGDVGAAEVDLKNAGAALCQQKEIEDLDLEKNQEIVDADQGLGIVRKNEKGKGRDQSVEREIVAGKENQSAGGGCLSHVLEVQGVDQSGQVLIKKIEMIVGEGDAYVFKRTASLRKEIVEEALGKGRAIAVDTNANAAVVLLHLRPALAVTALIR